MNIGTRQQMPAGLVEVHGLLACVRGVIFPVSRWNPTSATGRRWTFSRLATTSTERLVSRPSGLLFQTRSSRCIHKALTGPDVIQIPAEMTIGAFQRDLVEGSSAMLCPVIGKLLPIWRYGHFSPPSLCLQKFMNFTTYMQLSIAELLQIVPEGDALVPVASGFKFKPDFFDVIFRDIVEIPMFIEIRFGGCKDGGFIMHTTAHFEDLRSKFAWHAPPFFDVIQYFPDLCRIPADFKFQLRVHVFECSAVPFAAPGTEDGHESSEFVGRSRCSSGESGSGEFGGDVVGGLVEGSRFECVVHTGVRVGDSSGQLLPHLFSPGEGVTPFMELGDDEVADLPSGLCVVRGEVIPRSDTVVTVADVGQGVGRWGAVRGAGARRACLVRGGGPRGCVCRAGACARSRGVLGLC